MPITSLYAGIFGIFLVFLSINVIRLRIKKKVLLLDNNDYELSLAIRAQGNFIEYTPLFLILLFLTELNHWSSSFSHSIAVAFFIGRMFHAYSFTIAQVKNKKNYKARQIGMLLTLFILLVTGISLVISFLK